MRAVKACALWLATVCLFVPANTFAAATDAGLPSPQGRYETALEEFKKAQEQCADDPTPDQLVRLAKAAQDLADAKKAFLKSGQKVTGRENVARPLPSPGKPKETARGEIKDLFASLSDKGLSLSEAPEAGEKKPARFSYTQDIRNGNTGAQFDANFYLKWQFLK
jgi:hypothetical protein